MAHRSCQLQAWVFLRQLLHREGKKPINLITNFGHRLAIKHHANPALALTIAKHLPKLLQTVTTVRRTEMPINGKIPKRRINISIRPTLFVEARNRNEVPVTAVTTPNLI